MENNALVPVVTMVEAVDRPKIKTIPTPPVYNALVVMIAHLYTLRGQKPEAGDLKFQAAELEAEIRNSYSWLSLEEVRIALDNGVKKKYGEYFGLNVITYLDWIRAYNESEARRKAKQEAEAAKLPPPRPKTPEEIEEETRQGILSLYYLWSNDSPLKWCPDPEDDYDYLLKAGAINPTDDDKTRAIEYAKEKIRRLSADRDRRQNRSGSLNTISNIINKYKEGDMQDPVSERAVIKYAKAQIIFEFFASLKGGREELKSLLYE